MPTPLDAVRQQYPALRDLSDEDAIDVIHRNFYPDLPLETVQKAAGYTPPPPPPPQATVGDRVKDIGVSLARGGVLAVEAPVGILDMATGGRAGKFLDEHGVDLKGADQYWAEKYSPRQQYENQQVADAYKGAPGDDQSFLARVGRGSLASLQNPSTIVQALAQMLPTVAGAGIGARALLGAAPALETLAPALTGGAALAGQTAEQIRTAPENPSGLLTGGQSALAAGAGVATVGLGAFAGKLAQELGFTTAPNLIAGIEASPQAEGAKALLVKRVLGGAVTEGFLQQLPQSVQQQVAINLANDQPIDKDVDQAAVLGTMQGVAMGGASNVLPRPRALAGAPVPKTAPEHAQAVADILGAQSEDDAIAAFARATAAPTTFPNGVEVSQRYGGATREERVKDLQDNLADKRTRDQIRATSGDDALGTILYYANLVNNPNVPQRTRDNFLDLAERLAFQAQTKEVPEVGKGAEPPAIEGGPTEPPPPPGAPPALGGPPRALEGPEGTLPSPVDELAHAAAPSPRNDLPEPTDGQKEAGNYAKGHVRIGGLDVSIENPQGSVRSGVGADGQPWSNTLHDHYGYIRGTTGADAEHVDTFVKAGTPPDWKGTVFVVDQRSDNGAGPFDESKVMLGYANELDARAGYQRNYHAGWRGGTHIRAASFDAFKAWLSDPAATRRPFADWQGNGSTQRPPEARPFGAPALQDVEQHEGALSQPQGDGLRELRGPRDQGGAGVGSELPGVPGGSGQAAVPGAPARPGEQRPGLRAGQSALADQARAGQQPTQERGAGARGAGTDAGAVGGRDRAGAVGAALPDQRGSDERGRGANDAAARGQAKGSVAFSDKPDFVNTFPDPRAHMAEMEKAGRPSAFDEGADNDAELLDQVKEFHVEVHHYLHSDMNTIDHVHEALTTGKDPNTGKPIKDKERVRMLADAEQALESLKDTLSSYGDEMGHDVAERLEQLHVPTETLEAKVDQAAEANVVHKMAADRAAKGGARSVHEVQSDISRLDTIARAEARERLSKERGNSPNSYQFGQTKAGKEMLDRFYKEEVAKRQGQIDKLRRELAAANQALGKEMEKSGLSPEPAWPMRKEPASEPEAAPAEAKAEPELRHDVELRKRVSILKALRECMG